MNFKLEFPLCSIDFENSHFTPGILELVPPLLGFSLTTNGLGTVMWAFFLMFLPEIRIGVKKDEFPSFRMFKGNSNRVS